MAFNVEDKLFHLLCECECMDWDNKILYLISNGVTVQSWIPITEDKPKTSGEYIVWIIGANQPTSLWYNPVEDVWFNDDYRDAYPVSHWMQMPELPKEKEVASKGEKSPCRTCTISTNPTECNKKHCKAWKEWWLGRWEQIHNYGEKHKA